MSHHASELGDATRRYDCCDDQRRAVLRSSVLPLNGIDFLEVLDREAPIGLRQRVLRVRFVRDPAPALTKAQLRVVGGVRIRDVAVESVAVEPAEPATLRIVVDQPGDFSTYTLRLVAGDSSAGPPAGIDPALSSIDFSFKVECDAGEDCQAACECVPAPAPSPAIDYLVRDEPTFRRLMLDRMALLMPEWGEARRRHPADAMVTVVEVLAHVADRLAYRQDAVATEAYLGTARLRSSVRRHARLVDTELGEGRNARVFAQIQVQGGSPALLPRGTALCTGVPGAEPVVVPGSEVLERSDAVFETMHDAVLVGDHDRFRFHTFHGRRCCLPAGATAATLRGHWPHLAPGMFLVLAERCSPTTGREEDAAPTRRHAVRLVAVRAFAEDGGELVDPLGDGAVAQPITEIQWHEEDALPWDLCVSAELEAGSIGGPRSIEDVGVALGNIVLADHGRSVRVDPRTPFAIVPPTRGTRRVRRGPERCDGFDAQPIPARFRPWLPIDPVTRSEPCEPTASAAACMRWRLGGCACGESDSTSAGGGAATPAIALLDLRHGVERRWSARRDLLASGADDLHVVIESEHDGSAFVRFGDDRHGRRPESGTGFGFVGRVGNGAAGNIGAGALRHAASDLPVVLGVRNWLPAVGGLEPEGVDECRRRAPVAFRRQERAVTEQDHADRAAELRGVQRAVATMRWTGSWHTAFVTADRAQGRAVDAEFVETMATWMERFRMAGRDVAVDAPRLVALELELHLCVHRHHRVADVRRALGSLFTRGLAADGRPGLFHPDRFTFGQRVFLSPFVAAAQGVPGVVSVTPRHFRRRGDLGSTALDDGFIALGRMEIARLDGDPNFPEHGTFAVSFGGGR